MRTPSNHAVITQLIMQNLVRGIVPWRVQWERGLPMNLATGEEYRGINVFLLSGLGFWSRFWVTAAQAKELGGSVQNGQRPQSLYTWQWNGEKSQRVDANGELVVEWRAALQETSVFNVEQCIGLEERVEQKMMPVRAQAVLAGMQDAPEVQYLGARSYYCPFTDAVVLPENGCFASEQEHDAVLLHQLVHATGHAKRLKRPGGVGHAVSGCSVYGEEELVAEMGTALLCAHVGIGPLVVDDSVACVHGWLDALAGNKHMLVVSAAHAQRAVDYVLNGK